VLYGGGEIPSISEANGDISVIDGFSGRNRLCYNDGKMILPGLAKDWEKGGKYAANIAGMFRPRHKPK
jgi:hypothetical protein